MSIDMAELDRFARRVILDAILAASPAFWERRAHQLERAMPKRGDFTGRATAADLEARWAALAEAAAACRNRVRLLDDYDDDYRAELAEQLDFVLAEGTTP